MTLTLAALLAHVQAHTVLLFGELTVEHAELVDTDTDTVDDPADAVALKLDTDDGEMYMITGEYTKLEELMPAGAFGEATAYRFVGFDGSMDADLSFFAVTPATPF